jgi:hypothetical protein
LENENSSDYRANYANNPTTGALFSEQTNNKDKNTSRQLGYIPFLSLVVDLCVLSTQHLNKNKTNNGKHSEISCFQRFEAGW